MPLRPPFAHRPLLALLLLSPSLLLAAEAPVSQFDTVTVTATRSEQTLDQVPNSVSVQTERDIDQNTMKSIKDLVRHEPGVSVSGSGSRFGLSGFSIRGIGGNRVLTQVDGVGVADAFSFGPFQSAQRNYVDLDTIRQVEIIRGPASSLYGSNAIGGAVSFLTKDARDYLDEGDDAYARLKTGYDGSDDSWQRSATFAARLGQVDGLLNLGRRSGQAVDSYGGRGGQGSGREQANPLDYQTDNLLAKIGWDYAEGGRLQLAYERYRDDADSRLRSEEGVLSSTAIGPLMRSNSLITQSWADDRSDRERFTLGHQLSLDSLLADRLDWQLSQQSSETRQQTLQQRTVWTSMGAPTLPPPLAATLRERSRDSRYEEDLWAFNLALGKDLQLGDWQHELIYGLDLKRSKSRNLRLGSEVNRITGAPFVNPENFPLSDFPDPTSLHGALFVQDSISIGRWTLLPGLRYDHYSIKPKATTEYLNANRTEPNPPSFSDSAWSPKFGLTYQLDSAHSLFGQYAAGFRAPEAVDIFGEFSNPAHGYQTIANTRLKPETSHSLEAGLRGQYALGSLSASLFYNRYNDFIEQATVATAPLLTFQSVNLDRVDIRGAEFKGELYLDQLGLPGGTYAQASLAYAHGQDKGKNQPLNSIDPLKGVFGLGYREPGGRFGGELNWTLVAAKERIDRSEAASLRMDEQFRSPGYGILDLNAWWQLSEQVSLNGGLYNLTDKQYWQWGDVRGRASDDAGIGRYSQPGRHMAVNLIWEI